MEKLLQDIRRWFDGKREHLLAFACADCRVEGWFKGELLVLLDRLRQAGRLQEFEREANVSVRGTGRRTQVDFRLRLEGDTHLCELKALCISQAAGTPRNLRFYFREDKLGLLGDFRKLDSLEASRKWLLAFVYPRPSNENWDRAVASLPSDLRHWESFVPLADASDVLFVCLWGQRSGTDTRPRYAAG